MKKVLVGLSGGIDSFVTALLLQKQGFEVIGVNFTFWRDDDKEIDNTQLDLLCEKAGIKILHKDVSEDFRIKVITPFVEMYAEGLTPNPCSICNIHVKWNSLCDIAENMGIYNIATGHYVRVKQFQNRYYIYKGVDPRKDQSYFLWGVKEEILKRVITPLGNYSKEEVRKISEENGYTVLNKKKESMGICFLGKTDYRDFILNFNPHYINQQYGLIKTGDEKIIGEHSGLLNYTVGQKRGIPEITGKSMYVLKIDASNNALIVGEKSELNVSQLSIGQSYFINHADLKSDEIEIKIRGFGLNPEGTIEIKQTGDDKFDLKLSSPAWAPAPGQPVALYIKDRLIGGGITL